MIKSGERYYCRNKCHVHGVTAFQDPDPAADAATEAVAEAAAAAESNDVRTVFIYRVFVIYLVVTFSQSGGGWCLVLRERAKVCYLRQVFKYPFQL